MVQIAQDAGTRSSLQVGAATYDFACLRTALAGVGGPERFPASIAILLEDMLRQSGFRFSPETLEALHGWPHPGALTVPFRPSRVLLQDYTGIPVLVDLAALQEEAAALGLSRDRFSCQIPADLVIDHSLVVDVAAQPEAAALNEAAEMRRNRERFDFLKWAERTFPGLRLFPPGSGICHQINMEQLCTVVETVPGISGGPSLLRPDKVLGADSHTTMVGGLGVLGWGVGGLEALSALLGNAVTIMLPEVVGVRLSGHLPAIATATDLVLSLVHRLREHGVVGRFVEFCGPGLATLPAAHRATVANMAPESGATCLFFPVDEETLAYLRRTGRSPAQIELVEAYCRAQGLWRGAGTPAEPSFTEVIEFDLGAVGPSLAGPARPDQHLTLSQSAQAGRSLAGDPGDLVGAVVRPGDVVLAAITSCTNTANPYSIAAAGLLARNAVAAGLSVKPWVKTSFAPGSRAVAVELQRTGLDVPLEELGFGIVGFGCTTCIGNAGPLQPAVATELVNAKRPVAAVLSGNRNFANRVHPDIPANFLASPALVVAYALAGSMMVDLSAEPLGIGSDGNPVRLEDIWPSETDITEAVALGSHGTRSSQIREGWSEIQPPSTPSPWLLDPATVQRPPIEAAVPFRRLEGLRILGLFGDNVTTDHISPASPIRAESPAGQYLLGLGVAPDRLHSFGARRGNWRAMLLGAFTNRALRNEIVRSEAAGMTRHWPQGTVMGIQDASARYQAEAVGLVIVAGRNYGTGSSRDDAAKSTRFLGVKAVIAESFERIHRSNLLAMGVLPLVFSSGRSWTSLGWTGVEVLDLDLSSVSGPGSPVPCLVDGAPGPILVAQIETAEEEAFWRAGGLMPFLLAEAAQAVNSASVRLATETRSSSGT